MHAEVLDFVGKHFFSWKVFQPERQFTILEFGSLDINGSVRQVLQPHASSYLGVDLQEGPGVDIVASASTFQTEQRFDVIACCEVFEHTPAWREIIANSFSLLADGGLFLATMAGEGRHPHSAIDENPIREWEYYDNVGEWELSRAMKIFPRSGVNRVNFDIRCWGIK